MVDAETGTAQRLFIFCSLMVLRYNMTTRDLGILGALFLVA
jgi:hypothetical protein